MPHAIEAYSTKPLVVWSCTVFMESMARSPQKAERGEAVSDPLHALQASSISREVNTPLKPGRAESWLAHAACSRAGAVCLVRHQVPRS